MKTRKRRDVVTILFVCLAAAFIMTACMNSAGDAGNVGENTATPTLMTPPPTPAATQPPEFDWVNRSREVEEKLGQISEIAEARVISSGDTVLVGVKFAPAYQGQMTTRIRDMIAGEVLRADPSVKTVAVTADEDDVGRVYGLSDRVRAGEAVDTIKNDVDEIVRNTTTLT